MANIKKSFNFRNGVQVDDDNLKVSTTGLVGIGTTVPTESLDVRGNLVVSGVSSAVTAQAGVMTVTTLNPTEIIGAGVSIVSGIVTASSGIITFYGDARFLQGMPTSQWEDVNTGLGVSSIYNTGGNVGIATSNPQFTLQIGSNVNLSQNGVGISSAGDIKISGVATATKFVGALTGDVIGNVTGNLTGNVTGDISGDITASTLNVTGNITGNVTGDISGDITASTLNITGVTTSAGNINLPDNVNLQFGDSQDLKIYHGLVGGHSYIENTTGSIRLKNGGSTALEITNDGLTAVNNLSVTQGINASGIATFQDINVDGHTELDNVNVAGVTTFSGRIEGAATNNVIPFLYSDLASLPSAGSYHGAFAHVHATGRGYFAHAGNWWELVNKESDGRVGTGAELYNIGSINASGIITATTELNSPLIGVGTNDPANDIQVRKNGNVEIQVTSDTGTAALTVGREAGTNNTNNAEFRYGLVSGGSPYSSAQSLDILNYGTGNFNYHISANNPNAIAGDFHWHKGLNSTRLMTLTGIGGSLGIGNTQPTTKLDVEGGGKFTGDLEVTNNLTLGGSLTISAISANVTGNLTGNVTGNVTGLINSPVTGVSTITNLEITSVGIGTTSNGNFVNISSNANQKIIINNDSQVGIFTDTFDDSNVGVAINRNLHIKKAVSVGSTTRSAVDFSNAVNISNEGETGLPFNRSQLAYMIPPRVTTTQRNLLRDAYTNSATLISGAMVYNTTSKRIEVYIDGGWVGLATVA